MLTRKSRVNIMLTNRKLELELALYSYGNEKSIKTKRLIVSFNSKLALFLFNKILNSMWIIIYSEFPF
jgi:hypothetical protein